MVEEMLKHYLQQKCGVEARHIGFPVISVDERAGIEIDYVTDYVYNVNPGDLLRYAIEWGAKNA